MERRFEFCEFVLKPNPNSEPNKEEALLNLFLLDNLPSSLLIFGVFDKKEDSLYISLSSENTAFEDIHFFFNLFFGLKNKFLAFNGLLFKDLKLIIFFFLLSIFIDESKFEDIF